MKKLELKFLNTEGKTVIYSLEKPIGPARGMLVRYYFTVNFYYSFLQQLIFHLLLQLLYFV